LGICSTENDVSVSCFCHLFLRVWILSPVEPAQGWHHAQSEAATMCRTQNAPPNRSAGGPSRQLPQVISVPTSGASSGRFVPFQDWVFWRCSAMCQHPARACPGSRQYSCCGAPFDLLACSPHSRFQARTVPLTDPYAGAFRCSMERAGAILRLAPATPDAGPVI
jgi:hypothetical protein